MLNNWALWWCIGFVYTVFYVQPAVAPPAVHTIEIKEMKFIPATIQVKKGDTIIWTNRDIVVHNVTEEKSKAWASGIISAGKSWKMVATKSAEYFCSLHPVMKGKILVQ